MMEVTANTTLKDFLANGGDINEHLTCNNVRPGKITIKAKNSDIVIVGDTKAEIELDVDNTTVTIIEENDQERRDRVWERLFKQQAERHAKWDAMNK